jgi:hypothetical protein
MRHFIVITATAAALAGAACAHGGSQSSSATTTAAQHGETMARSTCPMTVPGTQVAAADTATGGVLTFTTTSPDQVAELRSRVRAMADMHNHHHSAEGGMGSGDGDGTAMSVPPVSTAAVEDTDQGARMVLTPTDASQVPDLQRIAREHAALMQAQGRCDMAASMEPSEAQPGQPGYTPGY